VHKLTLLVLQLTPLVNYADEKGVLDITLAENPVTDTVRTVSFRSIIVMRIDGLAERPEIEDYSYLFHVGGAPV